MSLQLLYFLDLEHQVLSQPCVLFGDPQGSNVQVIVVVFGCLLETIVVLFFAYQGGKVFLPHTAVIAAAGKLKHSIILYITCVESHRRRQIVPYRCSLSL